MIILILFAAVFGNFVDYSGYQVLRAEWENPTFSSKIYDFLQNAKSADMWSPEIPEQIFRTKSLDVMLSEEESDILGNILRKILKKYINI